ncbi:F-box domain-containing protein [Favolaschia claudopus]|uniref:F-box domain-containing protein n=1 Tax=Favolaschia claudopus TaxID=2862362 RepID=A0AAV9ZMJ6_9AGAR
MQQGSVPHNYNAASFAEDVIHFPFAEIDFEAEFFRHSTRDLTKINPVAAEAWKILRISRPRVKYAPRGCALDLLSDMQLDIIIEIITYLHPLELSQLARVNKAFRGLLNSSATDLIWRRSFLVDDDPQNQKFRLPRCPAGISGRQLTRLLYCPLACEVCGASIESPDYNLWRRICLQCTRAHLRTIPRQYKCDHELYSMIPRRIIVDRYHRTPEFGGFWRSDVTSIVAEYERLVAGGDSQSLVRFVNDQTLMVSKKRQLAEQCRIYSANITARFRTESRDKIERIVNSAEKRLVAEGFWQRDVLLAPYHMQNCPAFQRKSHLSTKIWRRARPLIVPSVLQAQAERLEWERRARINAKTSVILTSAILALRTPVAGTHRTYYCPPCTIVNFPPLAKVIDEEPEEQIAADDPRLVEALAATPPLVEAWAAEMKTILMSELLKTECSNSPQNPQAFDLTRLELATSVFRMHQTRHVNYYGYRKFTYVLVGWDDLRVHLHPWKRGHDSRLKPSEDVEFDREGSTVAAQLVLLAGMDPQTATVSEMNALDPRFVCESCAPPHPNYRPALRWRECILHVIEDATDIFHDTSSWRILSPVAAADLRRRQVPDDYSSLETWACGLCDGLLPRFYDREQVQMHLREFHEIDHSLTKKNLTRYMVPDQPECRPVMLHDIGAHPPRFRCNRCAEARPSIVKLFSKHAIKMHVIDKHSVSFSIDEYTEIELLL